MLFHRAALSSANQGEYALVLGMECPDRSREAFYVVRADFHGRGTGDQVQRKHDAESVFATDENAFDTGERSACDPDPSPNL